MTPTSSASGGGFQETRIAVPLASLFVTVTPWGALIGAKTVMHKVNFVDSEKVAFELLICTLKKSQYFAFVLQLTFIIIEWH